MCKKVSCSFQEEADPRWLEFRRYMKALHCHTRWLIIEYIGEGTRSTKDIYEYIVKNVEELSKSGLYYHLSELKDAEIIDVAEYIEEGGGAPEKIWKLKTKKSVIELLSKEG